MKPIKLCITSLTALLLAVSAISASADEVTDRVMAAMANPARDPADAARDEMRKPADTIAFVGIKTGMTVLDVSSGGGWYAEMLAAAVGPIGEVYAQNAARVAERVAPAIAAKSARFPNLISLTAENEDFGMAGKFDAAWTALNLHDFANRSHDDGLGFLKAIYVALKPGGVLGFIDHEGSAGIDNAPLHRIDVVTVRNLLKEAGFVIEAESDMLNNPDDDHSLGVREDSLRYHTDRLLMRAKKPAM